MGRVPQHLIFLFQLCSLSIQSRPVASGHGAATAALVPIPGWRLSSSAPAGEEWWQEAGLAAQVRGDKNHVQLFMQRTHSWRDGIYQRLLNCLFSVVFIQMILSSGILAKAPDAFLTLKHFFYFSLFVIQKIQVVNLTILFMFIS